MDESIALITTIQQHHRNRGYIAFIKKLGRDSHTFYPGSAAAATFEAGYDQAQEQYDAWAKIHFALKQEVA